ncbi:MAG: T9SS type A sorting domain-containing protein [candidate division Zixibacteria bacterium]|nr:T9SS type A sorting domain-containing protein [candidate division Zixibacteria bacterium]
MKTNRISIRARLLMATIFIFGLPSWLYAAGPKKFPKISFLEPYLYLRNTDKASQALTYYGQMESSGVNIIVGLLNSTTSPLASAFQYYNNESLTVNGWPVTRIGNSVFFEAEENDPARLDAVGYYFTPTTGVEIQDAGALGGDEQQKNARIGIAGSHSPGYLIAGPFGCVKSCARRPRFKTYYAKFRLKVPNTSLPDSTPVCSLSIRIGYDLQTVATTLLRLSNFPVRDQYQEVEISGFAGAVSASDYGFVQLQVFWQGNIDLYVDRIDFRDFDAKTLFGLSPTAVSNAFTAYYNSIDTARLLRWYPADELWASMFRTQKYFEGFSSVIGPRGKTTSEIGSNNSHIWSSYLSEIQAPQLDYFVYPFANGYDSSSSATHNVQHAIDTIFLPSLIKARQTVAQQSLPFYPMIQAVGQFDTLGNPIGFRDPQRPEIYVQVFLALTHGAKGIGYFTYTTVYHRSPLVRLIKEIPPDSMGEVTGAFPASSYPALHGLVDWNFHPTNPRFVPNYKWYAVRHADSLLDKIGPVLLDLTWDTAKIANSAIRYLDSLKSAQFSTPYVEAGFFKDSVNTDYFMLVNRRVLSTETQDVTAWLNKTGHSYVIDIFSGDTVLTGNVGTGAPLTTRLNPGEGKLFKIVPASTYIHGTVNHVTWQGKITVDGDVTIPSGKKLKILQPQAQVILLANRDTLHSGADINKCEFIVNGTMEGQGATTDPVKFASSSVTPGTQDWFGIRVFGSAKFTNCRVKNAYVGIDFQDTAYDTVRGCFFEKNFMFGIQARNSNVYIVQDTFQNNTNMGVCFDPASAVIESCYFKSNAIGIYTIGSFGRIANSRIIGTLYNSDVGLQAEGTVGGATQFLTFENNLDSGQFNLAAVSAHARLKVLNSRLKIYAPSGPLPEDPPDNVAVLSLGADSAIVRNSTVSYSGYSSTIPLVKVTAAPRLDLGRASPDPGNNSILRGWKSYSVGNYNTTTDSVYAKNNYWGGSASFTGPVAYVPYLASPPAKLAVGDEFEGPPALPNHFSLNQNYPNPFNPTTTISLSLPQAEKITLAIYNILGQKVRILVDDEKPAGVHTVIWDGTDSRGSPVSSGIYFYKLETSSFREVKRMLFLK